MIFKLKRRGERRLSRLGRNAKTHTVAMEGSGHARTGPGEAGLAEGDGHPWGRAGGGGGWAPHGPTGGGEMGTHVRALAEGQVWLLLVALWVVAPAPAAPRPASLPSAGMEISVNSHCRKQT